MRGYLKQSFAVAAAGLSGFAVGVYTVGKMAEPTPETTGPMTAELPAWTGDAAMLYLVATVAAAVAVAGWVWMDYQYGGE